MVAVMQANVEEMNNQFFIQNRGKRDMYPGLRSRLISYGDKEMNIILEIHDLDGRSKRACAEIIAYAWKKTFPVLQDTVVACVVFVDCTSSLKGDINRQLMHLGIGPIKESGKDAYELIGLLKK